MQCGLYCGSEVFLEYWLVGVGPSQVAEIVESILILGLDSGPISSFLGSKRGLLSGIHGKREKELYFGSNLDVC
jgi:hypothetical protein